MSLRGDKCGLTRGNKMNYLLEALVKKLEGDIEVAKANIYVYQKNAVGVGEHSDIVETIEKEVGKIADAKDKIEAIKGL